MVLCKYCKKDNIVCIEEIQTFKNNIQHIKLTCPLCNKFNGYKSQGNYKLSFGKYKGKMLKEIPLDYLKFLLTLDWINHTTRKLLSKYLSVHNMT